MKQASADPATVKALISASFFLGFVVGEIFNFLPSDARLVAASFQCRQLRPTPCAYVMARCLLVAWTVYVFICIVRIANGGDIDMPLFRRISMILLALNMIASSAILASRVLVLQYRRRCLMAWILGLLLFGQLIAGVFSTVMIVPKGSANMGLEHQPTSESIVVQFAATLALDVFFSGIIVASVLRKEFSVKECRVLRMLLIDAIVYVSLSSAVNVVTIVALFVARRSLVDSMIVIRVNVTICTALACRIFRSQMKCFKGLPPNSSSITMHGFSAQQPNNDNKTLFACPQEPAMVPNSSAVHPNGDARVASECTHSLPPLRSCDGPDATARCDDSIDAIDAIEAAVPSLRVRNKDDEDDVDAHDPYLKLDDFEIVQPRCWSSAPGPPHRRLREQGAGGSILPSAIEVLGGPEIIISESASVSRGRTVPSDGGGCGCHSNRFWNGGARGQLRLAGAGRPLSLDDHRRNMECGGGRGAPPEQGLTVQRQHRLSIGGFELPSPALKSSSPFGDLHEALNDRRMGAAAKQHLELSVTTNSGASDALVGSAALPSSEHADAFATTGRGLGFGVSARTALSSLQPGTDTASLCAGYRRGSDSTSDIFGLPARASSESLLNAAIEPVSKMHLDPATGRYVVATEPSGAEERPRTGRQQTSDTTIVPRPPQEERSPPSAATTQCKGGQRSKSATDAVTTTTDEADARRLRSV